MISKKELKQQINELKAEFNLGKNGISPSFIQSVDKYLDAHSIVKIKASIATDKNSLLEYAQELANELNAEILEKKGFTFILFRD